MGYIELSYAIFFITLFALALWLWSDRRRVMRELKHLNASEK